MPTEQAEINEFWIQEFKTAPKASTTSKPYGPQDSDDENEDEDDWRTYFEAPEPTASALTSRTPRSHKLSTLQSLHSLQSHRAQFTACWLALLPHLSSSMPLSLRALNILHHGVMPHLTRPLRLMDWVANCVDFGTSMQLPRELDE